MRKVIETDYIEQVFELFNPDELKIPLLFNNYQQFGGQTPQISFTANTSIYFLANQPAEVKRIAGEGGGDVYNQLSYAV